MTDTDSADCCGGGTDNGHAPWCRGKRQPNSGMRFWFAMWVFTFLAYNAMLGFVAMYVCKCP